jgi:hypothetical protein
MKRAQTSIRWREIRLAAFSAAAFGAALAALLPSSWPLMPFPELAPLEIAALLGLLAGVLLRRAWVLALPVTALVALDPSHSGFAGSLVALLVVWPFAASGAVVGIASGRWVKRRLLRRTLRAARRPARVTPRATAGASIRAARGDSMPVAGAGH